MQGGTRKEQSCSQFRHRSGSTRDIMSPGPPNRALKPTVPFVTGLAGAATLDDASPIRAEPVYHGRLVKQVPRRTAGGPTAPGGRAGGLAWSLGGPRFSWFKVSLVYAEPIGHYSRRPQNGEAAGLVFDWTLINPSSQSLGPCLVLRAITRSLFLRWDIQLNQKRRNGTMN